MFYEYTDAAPHSGITVGKFLEELDGHGIACGDPNHVRERLRQLGLEPNNTIFIPCCRNVKPAYGVGCTERRFHDGDHANFSSKDKWPREEGEWE